MLLRAGRHRTKQWGHRGEQRRNTRGGEGKTRFKDPHWSSGEGKKRWVSSKEGETISETSRVSGSDRQSSGRGRSKNLDAHWKNCLFTRDRRNCQYFAPRRNAAGEGKRDKFIKRMRNKNSHVRTGERGSRGEAEWEILRLQSLTRKKDTAKARQKRL